jgi:hypothetical protein
MTAAQILLTLACGAPSCPCTQSARRGSGPTHCPAHDDRSPSLSVRELNGRTLVHDFGGCEQARVIDALADLGLWGRRPDRRGAAS